MSSALSAGRVSACCGKSEDGWLWRWRGIGAVEQVVGAFREGIEEVIEKEKKKKREGESKCVCVFLFVCF